MGVALERGAIGGAREPDHVGLPRRLEAPSRLELTGLGDVAALQLELVLERGTLLGDCSARRVGLTPG
jgi:hypothetical protein